MNYNFDEIVPRQGTHSIKWEAAPNEGVLPMWVADMDFKAAPSIVEALQERVSHRIFGYTQIPETFYTSVIRWWQKRHGLALQQSWIIPVSGAITGLTAAVKALTSEGDKVLIQPPIYNHFYTTIRNAGCEAVENNLLLDHGHYTIDFDDLEQKASDPGVKLLLLCNPHNPVGRVWKKEELTRLAAVCYQYNITILSDEIHSDLVYPGHSHMPMTSIAQEGGANCITIASPSKSFNLAGLQAGYLFTENTSLQAKIRTVLTEQDMELLNPFGIEALMAAYDKGEAWLEALLVYLRQNYDYLQDFMAQHLPLIKVVPLEATYLVWLDCTALLIPSATLSEILLRDASLWLNPGTLYGKAGEGFLRINIACPLAQLQEGLLRMRGLAVFSDR